jgi:hypothetical protein
MFTSFGTIDIKMCGILKIHFFKKIKETLCCFCSVRTAVPFHKYNTENRCSTEMQYGGLTCVIVVINCVKESCSTGEASPSQDPEHHNH